jgi:cytochrome c-type biogenesis protein CcmE
MTSRLAALALLFAVSCGKKDAEPKVYAVGVAQLATSPDRYLGGKEVVVRGWVLPGSISRVIVDQEVRTTFDLREKDARITVKHVGPVPDTLKDEAELVVHGTVAREGSAVVVTTGEGGIMAVMPEIPGAMAPP